MNTLVNFLVDPLRRMLGKLADWRYKEFHHEPLRFKKSIRLITIEPQTLDCLVHCSVNEVNLDPEDSTHNPNLEYETLSYTWYIDGDIGKPTKGTMQTIICNDRALKVHQNLYNGLLQLRRLKRSLPIWIDAICINQNDDDEKSSQVKMMGEIFGRAKTVVVWLGRKTLGTRVALAILRPLLKEGGKDELGQFFVKQSQKDRDLRYVLADIGYSRIFSALHWIVGRGVFERVWTLQEIVLAKKLIFYLGDETIPLEKLVETFPYIDNTNINATNKDREYGLGKALTMLRGLSFLLKTREKFLNGTHCPLETALNEARRRKSSKPADKVFAILSISDSTQDIDVNYRRNVAKVYCECARKLITGPTGLRLLSLVGQLRRHSDGTRPEDTTTKHIAFPSVSTKHLIADIDFLEGLPSWVPDLNVQPRPLPLENLVQTVVYAAATSINPDFQVLDSDKFHLKLKVAFVDVITNIGDVIDTAAHVIRKPWRFIDIVTGIVLGPANTYKPTGEPIISIFQKTLVAGEIATANVYKKGETIEINESHFAEWFATMADTLMLLGEPALKYISQEEEVYFTLQEFAVNVDEIKSYYSATENAARAKYKVRAIRKFISMYDSPAHGLRDRLQEKFNRPMPTYRRMGVDINPDLIGVLTPYRDMFEHFYLHRCLFITGKGYMGTGPWTVQKNDRVALVAGASVPFIFRQRASDQYELVGEAYCHGMMGGFHTRNGTQERLPGLNLDDLNFEYITVV
ncbi:HET-domain-containing protein [Dendrothele bispora CBS 962.96]|uniref:HET-domain-containing protein n=1 Tax=Dendrothele bispora (strain CBS 962.96) TaxID=1314807 RepID=A0A4S8MIU3_DENBC|nr:HET-domain-containing protein [Dendrothele bispora CBS 962.96]